MSALDLDRPIPQSPEAEKAVLGSVLIEPRTLARIQPLVTPEMFSDKNRLIFSAMVETSRKAGGSVETLTVKETLVSRGELAAAGGHAYVSSLVDVVPDVANVERYATIVREKAEARGILLACNAAMREILDGATATSVASSLRHVLGRVGVSQDRRSRGIGDVALDVRKRADERKAAGQTLGVRTGHFGLDKRTGGYRRRQLSLIAARSSHGKTALLVNQAIGAMSVDPDVKIALYSLEMGDESMVNIIRSTMSKIPLQRLSEWETIPEFDRQQVLDVDDFLMRWNGRFYFNDRLSDIDDVCADARRLKEDRGLDAVFVDYLQLLSGFTNEKVRERVVNQLGKQIFDLAKQINVAGVALSQVTRPGFDRLSLDDLRESKAIGHDAWLVLMLNRPWQAHKDEATNRPCEATLQLEKNRGGRTGDIPMHFAGNTQTFTESQECTCKKAETR